MLLFRSLLAYLGIHGVATTHAPYLWGLHPAHRKKLGVPAKSKLKLTVFHCYPDSSWAEQSAGITGKAQDTAPDFTMEFASDRLRYLLMV